MKNLTLSSKHQIPQLGLGTWELRGEQCRTTVVESLEMGYRHIDTADAYGNHQEVGNGIADSGVPRDSIFLTTKIPMSSQSSEAVRQFGDRMREELGVEFVDLLLIHWPMKKVSFEETLAAMKKLVEKGYVRSIGISNFNSEIAAEAASISEIPIVTNQVEFHPLLFQRNLLDACSKLGMAVTAYSPLGRGKALTHPTVTEIAANLGASPSQVCITWLLRKNIIVIPKATGREHLKANLTAADIVLDDAQAEAIDSIEESVRGIDGSWKQYEF